MARRSRAYLMETRRFPRALGFGFRRGGGRRGTTMEHGAEFGNLSVYPPLLFLESKNGGIEYFGGEFMGGHKN